MFDSRHKKIVRDLIGNKGRTLLVVLAIAIGVFAFGSVFIANDMLLANMQKEYESTNPSTLSFSLSDFNLSLVKYIERQDGVKSAQGKVVRPVKVVDKKGNEVSLNLTAVPNYKNMKLNLLQPKKGSWPPAKNELIIERNSFPEIDANVGDEITVKLADDTEKSLDLAGIVYDNSAIPFMFTRQLTGFISWETLPNLGFSRNYNYLEIATDENIKVLADAEKLAFDIGEKLKEREIRVNNTNVQKPNEHWAENNSRAFTAILSVIGVFSLVLSGFLVINTISAVITQQKKQIGVMKAIGGTQKQVTGIYLTMVLSYGILSLFVALPIGIILGKIFLNLVTDFLNLDSKVFYLPVKVLLMQVAASLFVPLVAALYPILRGSKDPIRVSLSDYQSNVKSGRIENLLAKIRGLPRPILVSFRNVFRKKGRLVLTLGTLTMAGGMFMSVLNVRNGMNLELARILQMFDFEVSIGLSKGYDKNFIVKRIEESPEVVTVEARNGISVRRLKEDGTKGAPFFIIGLDWDTSFSHPTILSGRWLKEGDREKIVLSSGFIRDNPDISVNDVIKISYGEEKEVEFEVIGINTMSAQEKLGFSLFDEVSTLRDEKNLATSYLISTRPNDSSTQELVRNKISDRLERSGINVGETDTRNQIFSSAENQFNFMIFFLLAMALMIAMVGALGLAGTMGLNVMERTREIGVMRSIGADNATINKIVLVEGIMVGILSWLVAIPLSLPITYGFCLAIGNAFFGRTLVFDVEPQGILIWLLIVILVSTIASLLPARKASRISISETLAYE